ncbi:MAG: 2OG-Fe(II) oxygenase [Myxococcota bacterium]|nr:2OG-Fe(II) oxygenase [Myxococcota bacterium]
MDEAVRRCHQLEADEVTVPPDFAPVLAEIAQAAADQLGVVGSVQANLYKLLVYGPGDFFIPHRDTEKEPGMFGTLVVTLPAEFTGGGLVVRHGGACERVDLQPGTSGVRWVAFYADCTHEVLPLVDGVRVALVYNLVRAGAPTHPADDGAVVDALATELGTWTSEGPVKLAWALEHRYSEAELGWDGLKGADNGQAHALRRAAQIAGVDVHLALLSVDMEWSAEELQYRSRRRRGRWGRGDQSIHGDDVPDDIALFDALRDDRLLGCFIAADGSTRELTGIPVREGEVWPQGVIDDEPPDHVSYHEATGNEGATLTQLYRRAVVVLWPRGSEDALLIQCGLEAVASALSGVRDAARVERLVRAVLDDIAYGNREAVRQLLEALAEHRMAALGVEVLERRSRLDRSLVPPLAMLLESLDETSAATAAAQQMARLGPWDGEVAVDLLAVAARRATLPSLWTGLAETFAARRPCHSETADSMAVVVDAAWTLDLDVLKQTARSRLGDDARFDDAVAAALLLEEQGCLPEDWREGVVTDLRRRVATPPTKPTDFVRDPVQHCDCEDCRALSSFLRDPSEDRWVYGVREDRRRHLKGVAKRERLDITTRVLKSGRPHKLVCTKTTGRYERAVDRFARHVNALALLEDP